MNGTDIGWALTIQSELRKFRVRGGRIEILDRIQVPGEGNSRICRIDPQNSRLAIGKSDGRLMLFNTATRVFHRAPEDPHTDGIQAMVWLGDMRLCTGSRDGMIAIWDVSKEGEASLWFRLQLDAPVSDIAPTTDGKGIYIACQGEGSLIVLNLEVIDHELLQLISNSTPTLLTVPAFAAGEDVEIRRSPRGIAGSTPRPTSTSEANAAPASDYLEAERDAAEWVLSVGGTVALKDSRGNALPLIDGRLPECSFVVDAVGFDGSVRDFSPAGLTKIVACRKLTTLNFVNATKITDDALAELTGVRVRDLIVLNCPLLTDKSLASIGQFHAVESINARGVGFTDEGITALTPLRTLQRICVSTTKITDVGLDRLAEACPQITEIDMYESMNGQQTLSGVRRFHSVKTLLINGNQLTEDAVTVINSLSALTSLTIVSPMDDESVARLARVNTIQNLALCSNVNGSSNHLASTFFSDIAWPARLQTLTLFGEAVSPRDEDLLRLATLPRLNLIQVTPANQPSHAKRWTFTGFRKLRELRPDVSLFIDGIYYPAGKPLPEMPASEHPTAVH